MKILNEFTSYLSVGRSYLASPRILETAIAAEIGYGAIFEVLRYPVDFLNHLKLIQFSRNIDSRVIAGLGVSESEPTAYLIAIFEYFERKAVAERGSEFGFRSTNGVAAHRLRPLAFRAGRDELLERDAFLRHWYSGRPFYIPNLGKQKATLRLIEGFRSIGFDLQVRVTYLGFLKTVAVFLIDMNSGGFVVGLSAGKHFKKNLEKAVIEASTNLFFGQGRTSEGCIKIKPGLRDLKSLRDHRNFWLYDSTLPEFVRETAKCAGEIRKVPALKKVVLCSSPVPVVGVSSPSTLELILGRADQKTLSILSSSNLNPADGPPLPHPIP